MLKLLLEGDLVTTFGTGRPFKVQN